MDERTIKKTIAITAPTGMLGSMVYNVLKDRYTLVLIFRDEEKLKVLDAAYGGVSSHKKVYFDLMDLAQDYMTGFPTATIGPKMREFREAVGEVDAFINCAGIIKPYSTKDPMTTLFINGALPHILSMTYRERLIQITTDCTYNGLEGAPYDERSLKTPNDLYGLSKSLGEPALYSLALRTSIIGPEIAGFVSLISWFRAQEGKTIKGFTNHFWNGITTREFGNICGKIIENRNAYPQTGLFHIFSTDVSKYDMLLKCKEKYKVNVTIEPVEAPPVDRRLATVYDLCARLQIPSFDNMLQEL